MAEDNPIRADPRLPIDLEVRGQTPHVLAYRVWTKAPGEERWVVATEGHSEDVNGFLELLAESRQVDEGAVEGDAAPPDEDDGTGIWSAGIEARVAEGLWASAGFGSRFAALHEEGEKTFVAIGLRWGISSAARMEVLRGAAD